MDQAILDKLVADLKGLGTLTPSGEKITTAKGAYDTVVDAVTQVELIKTDAGTALSGSDKKSLVIAVVDQFVSIPLLPQWLMNDLLSYGLDLLITFLNSKFGDTWVSKIIS